MLELIEKGLFWWNSYFLEADAEAYSQLLGPVDDHTWMLKNGDLCSVIDIVGSRLMVGQDEFDTLVTRLTKRLSVFLRMVGGTQHSFAFGARDDASRGVQLVNRLYMPVVESMRRMGITDLSIIKDRARAISALSTAASGYVILYTHKAALTPNERDREKERRERDQAKYLKGNGKGMSATFGQSPFVQSPILIPRHKAAVEALVRGLGSSFNQDGIDLLCNVLNVEEAVCAIGAHLHAAPRADWKPRLIGAGATTAMNNPRPGDHSNLMPLPVGRQLIDAKSREIFSEAELVLRDGYYYASIVMEQMPTNGVQKFSELRAAIAGGGAKSIPWVVSFSMDANGLGFNRMEQTFAGFLGGFGDYNKRIKAAYDALRRIDQAEPVVGMRIVFTTWAKTEQACVDNLAFLKIQVQNWGSTVATNETGSPLLAQLASAAGYSYKSPAPYMPAPLSEACKMLPLFDSASIFQRGQVILSTLSGRPYPIEFGSTLQNFWGTGIFAPTGSGKSFFLLMLNLGFALAAGANKLNRIVNIDVGASFKLLVDLLHAMLPPEQRHQVVYLKVSNRPEFAVNPFDTHLGIDQPTNLDEEFLQSVLATVSPSVAKAHPNFLGMVIQAAYTLFGRNSKDAKPWQEAFDQDLHNTMLQAGVEFTKGKTRVWDVVDALFAKGMVVEAARAQRFAVPTLNDMVRAARAPDVINLYTTATVNGEPVLDVFTRDITTGVNNFRLIAGVTQCDIESARVLGIDLEEVLAGTQTESGRRVSQMMYLFARRLGARKFFMKWEGEIEALCPPLYAEHHRRECESMAEAPKMLEYDEIHNARGGVNPDGSPEETPMYRMIQKDMREGRKYLTVTLMSSQMLEDFPPAAIENMYNFFILGMGSSASKHAIQETFSLRDTEINAIENHCTGPGTLFGYFKTRRGNLSQVLRATAGPLERWAYNTDSEDASMRRVIAERIPYLEALALLARKFPSGSARDVLAKMKQDSTQGHDDTGYVRRLAERLLVEDVT